MKRKSATIISILITLLIALNVIFFNTQQERKTIYVTEVIDGDTFKVKEEKFRLININAPERSEAGYKEAKEFISQIEKTTIEIEEISTDRYQRILVRAYSSGYLNLELVKKGLAKKFLVHESELSQFDNAERSAVEKGLGIWEKSNLYGCLETEMDEIKEIVKIESICGTLNLKNFIVADESRKKYKFPDIATSEVNLHSFEGKDNETDVFWNSKSNIWNNDRDTIYIFDSENLLVYHDSYGY